MLGTVLIIALLLLPLVGLRPTTAAAASPGITVLQSTAKNDFPTSLTFAVQATSPATITSVRLIYQVGDDPVISIADAKFVPSAKVTASYQIDLNREYYPPGATVRYRWQIEDQSSAKLLSDWKSLAISDPRFTWQSQTAGPITLHWYDGNSQFATALLQAATQAVTAANFDVNAPGIKPVQIWIYAQQNDFRSALGSGAEQWVGGQTLPNYRVILLFAPSNDIPDDQRSVAHEMTHILLDSSANDPFGQLPIWLDEGVAVVAEGAPDPAFQQALAAAAQSHQLLSIQAISGNFPSSTNEATLAYAESQDIVRYFIDTYGSQKLSALIAAFRAGDTSDAAFQQSIQLSTLAFQNAWEAHLHVTPASQPARAAQSPLVTVISAPGRLIATVIETFAQLFQATKGKAA
ncbi:MAG TPA: peptidase MA family metallohydrolase [Chloroflexota bacterium]|nr:peptidase MA family metallohydrolase [Chloroflexota bacterium]